MALIKCTECNNEVSDKASSCPKCGSPIQHSKIEEQRAAVSQSNLSQDLSGPFMFQILLVAIAIGVYKESWLVFGGIFLGLMLVLMIPVIGKIVGVALACAFGAIGYTLGTDWWGQEAGYVVGAFFFIVSIAASLGGIEYMNDISKK